MCAMKVIHQVHKGKKEKKVKKQGNNMGYKMQIAAYKYELNIILVIACHML